MNHTDVYHHVKRLKSSDWPELITTLSEPLTRFLTRKQKMISPNKSAAGKTPLSSSVSLPHIPLFVSRSSQASHSSIPSTRQRTMSQYELHASSSSLLQ
jgi:hypothetical protein